MKWTRVAVVLGALGLGWIVVFGGEYSTFDWLKLESQLREERQAVVGLGRTIDSLTLLAHDLDASPATLERVAREQFGMIRNGEILYRLVPSPDSGVHDR
ncbi:MAG TPA: septum formation initiator family protein [Gemmatimonadales bacterium]|nr:septum formation initiator family protein [Gemmatimonadales bacterium]